jgi:hypothetical protein
MAFLTKRRMTTERRPCTREKGYVVANNGEITFTYKEARDKYGLSAGQFKRAIDDLVRVGFIDVTKSGYGLHKDVSLYSLSDRWRSFGTPEFKEKARDKRMQDIGFKPGNRLGRNSHKEDFQQSPTTTAQLSQTTVENSAPIYETALAGMKTGCRSDGHNSRP